MNFITVRMVFSIGTIAMPRFTCSTFAFRIVMTVVFTLLVGCVMRSMVSVRAVVAFGHVTVM